MAKQAKLSYNSLNNTMAISINSDEVLPAYLHYMLEANKLPQNATIIFNDMTVKLKKNGSEYDYERINEDGT